MVTASNNSTTTTATPTGASLVLLVSNATQISSNGSTFHEARRLPEVTDDAQSSEMDTLPTPSLDSWKPTIKDHKVSSLFIQN